jgi:hypothetical protein
MEPSPLTAGEVRSFEASTVQPVERDRDFLPSRTACVDVRSRLHVPVRPGAGSALGPAVGFAYSMGSLPTVDQGSGRAVLRERSMAR